jgi:predicted dehydrogenase
MRIGFREWSCSIPSPVAGAGERAIRVEKYATFPRLPRVGKSRFEFSDAVEKVLFFLLREGPRRTYAKVRASLLQRRLLAAREVVLAYGREEENGRHAIGISVQDCPRAEVLVFPAAFCMDVERGHDLAGSHRLLLGYFLERPEDLEELFHHSSFSGIEPSFRLAKVLSAPKDSARGDGEPALVETLLFPETPEPPRHVPRRARRPDRPDLFLAGAGAYAYAYILPALRRKVRPHTLVDRNPLLAFRMAEKFGFPHVDTDLDRALGRIADCSIPLVVVATYHSTHTDIAAMTLERNPAARVFLEKPPVTSMAQLERLLALRANGAFIEIGFNRRYSPFVRKAKRLLDRHDGPIVMTCIVKELAVPPSHWYYWPSQGTRIVGNLCHWLDLGVHCIGQRPVDVSVVSPPDVPAGDEASVVVRFADGSRLTVVATDKGNPLRGVQEHIDIRRGDLTLVIDDFLGMKVQERGRQRVHRTVVRDKGHLAMYREFIRNAEEGGGAVYSDADLRRSAVLYLTARDAALQGDASPLALDLSLLQDR